MSHASLAAERSLPDAADPPRSAASAPVTAARAGAPFLRIDGISKHFGSFAALSDVSLDVEEGEFVCFLGPSGCGKSTLLRVVAGLERQSAGRIVSAGQDLSTTPPSGRRFGILFQSYALFPNLSVRENIAYGLRNRRARRAEIDARVAELLRLVDLVGAEGKVPAQLSGGQQQRVALARAIAPSPRLLLLDEPLSALDAKVRVHLRHQIRALQKQLGLTTIMVTHDQEEALTMADRVMVMKDGRVEQVGTPLDIYHHPRTPFVANFVGRMNFLPGTLTGTTLRVGRSDVTLPPADTARPSGPVSVGIRPECIRVLAADDPHAGALDATVSDMEFLGAFWRATLRVPALEADLVADAGGLAVAAPHDAGDRVRVAIPPDRLIVFPAGQVGAEAA